MHFVDLLLMLLNNGSGDGLLFDGSDGSGEVARAIFLRGYEDLEGQCIEASAGFAIRYT